jgi:hypothetical protein|tara:strand:+ start:40 stop:405 length:366 start_codon:yes stop_codon:yes gene_type:complete
MGLKTDIYNALEKNIGKEHIKNSPEGKAKVDTLADDLSKAVINFITAQTFRVDKLTMNYTSKGSPVTVPMIPGPAASAQIIPHLPFGIDKDGQSSSNPMAGGLNDSNTSEVRLRKSEVTEK